MTTIASTSPSHRLLPARRAAHRRGPRRPRPGAGLRRHATCSRSSTTTGTGPSSRSSWCRRSPSWASSAATIAGLRLPGPVAGWRPAWSPWSCPAATAASTPSSACSPAWRWARSTCWAARSRSSAGCPAMATLDKIGAFALTEPDHGSDSVGAGDHRPPRRRPLGAQRRQALDRQRQHRRRRRRLGPRRRRRQGQGASSSRRTPDGTLPRRLLRRADHRQDRQAGGLAARRHPARRAGAGWTTSSPRPTRSATPPGC